MYRNSGLLSVNKSFIPTTPPGELTDFEYDILEELSKKRKQLDEEIVKFKTQKEKEFRDFEKDLRLKRKRSQSPSSKDTSLRSAYPTSNPVLSLLAAGSKPQANGNTQPHKRSSDGYASPKSKPVTPASKPTLSLDKLTINGLTTPPVPGTPPPHALTRTLSRSPSRSQIPPTPPRLQPGQTPPTILSKDRDDSLLGLFAPAYLPLLDSGTNSRSTQQSKTGSSNQSPSTHSQLQPQSSSLPHESPTMLSHIQSKRALTTPILPSTSLPSALRTASGTSMRKRKHVTFQLAGHVVEPSSSYEEMSSPDIPSDDEHNKIDDVLGASLAKDEAAKGPGLETTLQEQKVDSPPVSTPQLPNPDNSFDGSSSVSSSFGPAGLDNIPEAADGGSGVGFFELDEELSTPSPIASPTPTARATTGAGGRAGTKGPVNFFDDIPMDSDPETTTVATESDEVADEEEEQDSRRGRQIRKTPSIGRHHDYDDENSNNNEKDGLDIDVNDLKYTSFTSGSVPIDIVRPTGSWVGSFGH